MHIPHSTTRRSQIPSPHEPHISRHARSHTLRQDTIPRRTTHKTTTKHIPDSNKSTNPTHTESTMVLQGIQRKRRSRKSHTHRHTTPRVSTKSTAQRSRNIKPKVQRHTTTTRPIPQQAQSLQQPNLHRQRPRRTHPRLHQRKRDTAHLTNHTLDRTRRMGLPQRTPHPTLHTLRPRIHPYWMYPMPHVITPAEAERNPTMATCKTKLD